ncbi:MAG: nucleotidyltransferase domain-containing protein [Fibrobacteres bacterium]|nr:nucleotidyltransferase domain-containing protein [Fibrobacterota bacterium]
MGMTLEELRAKGWIVFEAISGSRAYGLHTATSDTDIKGVFVQPLDERLGGDLLEQVSSPKNDEVYWELGKFIELLAKANPSALELLHPPQTTVRVRHPLMARLDSRHFLSNLCKDTFAGYAMGQVKRARGLNKKIVNPQPEIRRGVLDFCHVTHGTGSLPARTWLAETGMDTTSCGLCAIDHIPNLYALFVDPSKALGFKGLVRDEEHSTEPCLSSVPKDFPVRTHLFWNKDAYAKHCRDHAEYWEWVKLRNDDRFQSTMEHGKNYDAKNMMHTFRLLHMAREILSGQGVLVDRTHDREELLEIRAGKFSYEELVARAETLIHAIESIGQSSQLPEPPPPGSIAALLTSMRRAFDRLEPWAGADQPGFGRCAIESVDSVKRTRSD